MVEISEQEEKLQILNQNLSALLDDESDWLANLANASALIFNQLDEINWAGFYLLRDEELILGPFQGKTACVRISIGNGVCGTAVEERRTCRVEDVHQFPGHIACDPASQSELVIPLFVKDEIIGVLDIDSPVKGRFTQLEQDYLEEFVDILIENTNFGAEDCCVSRR